MGLDYTDLITRVAKWVWGLISGIGTLMQFLFTPLSTSIQQVELPNWVATAFAWLVGIFGDNISPIMLIGVTGLIIAFIVGVVKAFV